MNSSIIITSRHFSLFLFSNSPWQHSTNHYKIIMMLLMSTSLIKMTFAGYKYLDSQLEQTLE